MNNLGSSERIVGMPAAPGVGLGRALVYRKKINIVRRKRVSKAQVENEVERFQNILHVAGEEIRRVRRVVSLEQGEELARIFDAQLAMLEDVEIIAQTKKWIREKYYSAEYAFSVTIQQTKKMFREIENDYLRSRISDVLDIENQVLLHLGGSQAEGLQSLRTNTVIFAHDLLPSDMVRLERRRVKGIVLDAGGTTSHAAIIARSLGLPTVVNTINGSVRVQNGDEIVIDGNAGFVHLRPDNNLERFYRSKLRRQQRRRRDLVHRRMLPPETVDGHTVDLLANIDLATELQIAQDNGARGVGMYRTEYLFLGHRLPTEEEQFEAYSTIVKAVAPAPVTIRTIDLGGDKLSHVMDVKPEDNPFLGWRGIRVCLDETALFKAQLKALLRAGSLGEVQILLPMVSDLSQVTQVRELLREVQNELSKTSHEFCESCKIGIMVEVPAVVMMIDEFASTCDFLSLGTNDLTQYALAVDRGTSRVAGLYDPFNPAVLRMIKAVVEAGKRNSIPVSICGEMAGDPLATQMLIGLGLNQLSLSPGLIPEVKEVIRSTKKHSASLLADRCLNMKSGIEVRDYLAEEVGDSFPVWMRSK